MSSDTLNIIQYITSDIDVEALILELYLSSLDDTTFRYHMEYFLKDQSNLPAGKKKLGYGHIQWKPLTNYFIDKYKAEGHLYSDVLTSYYQDKFIKEQRIRNSKRYKFVRKTGSNGSQYWVYLKKTKALTQ